MPTILEEIQTAANGLFYLSESDYPFEGFQWQIKADELPGKLIAESGKPAESVLEKVTLEYFLRNMVKLEDEEMAGRFVKLQKLLKEKFTNIEVYRVGSIQVKVFIVGQLADGSYAGLSTTSIET